MKEIKKPTIIKLKETEEKLVEDINNSELPSFILKPIIERILKQVELLEQQELINETNNYNELLKKERESDK